ncbi:hypothetical protein M9H77_14488 [Catharanthus roseus]|uniref:Uncharacterized protein n=1 Tax=Catharanthus roseus TaxID=4058 RepID=A0ACC0BNG4_CATRO|nr:hypothetical protein M9H77_14488 [Catharanthus roseus]
MEEVPAHVHPGPIVIDVLSRQHEYRSGLIWSGDRETCYTDLQCRRFGRNLFQCHSAAPRRLVEIIDRTGHFSGYKVKKEPLEAWILRAFTDSETDDDLILHMLPDLSGNLVHLMTEIQADPLAPLGAIWCTAFDCSQLPTHTLVTYRDQLDFMPSDQVRFTIACIICNLSYLHFY